jgi:hypothetical protein
MLAHEVDGVTLAFEDIGLRERERSYGTGGSLLATSTVCAPGVIV